MTDRVLYLERADRGDRLEGLRLVGAHGADAWHAPHVPGIDGALAAVKQAAEWTRDRLQGDRGRLGAICLDPDGSICSWLTTPSHDPAVMAAIARSGGHTAHAESDDAALAMPTPRALDHFAGVGAGLTIQSLSTDDAGTTNGTSPAKARASDAGPRHRVAVLGVPDSAPAMLIDALDDLGLSAPVVTTLWHEMARAWDAGARADEGPRADRLVAESSPVVAIVLVEPAGRLVWAWSRAGSLVTGGSMRLPRSRVAPPPSAPGDAPRISEPTLIPRLEQAHASRLAADWLAWSAQTGAAPARVVVLTPESIAGLQPAELGSALVRAWPQATIDLIADDDPVLLTLRRAMGGGGQTPDAPSSSVAALTHRPGRSHRAMFTWTALALAGLAVAAGAVGVMAWRTGASARSRADTLRRNTAQRAFEHYEDPTAYAAGIIITLQDDLAREQAASRPADASEFKPVLQEMQTISLVVSSLIASSPRSQFVSLMVDNTLPTRLVVRVPDLTTYEYVRDALRDAGPSELVWNENPQRIERPDPTGGGPLLECTFQATWRVAGPGTPGGGLP